MTDEDVSESKQTETEWLLQLRSQIDDIDQHLLALVKKRQQLSAEVAQAKPKGSPIFRPGREHSLLTRLSGLAESIPVPLVSALWRALMSASITTQNPNFTVGYMMASAGAAAQFSAGMMLLQQCDNAAAGCDALASGAVDIMLLDDKGLSEVLHRLGPDTSIYITAILPMVRSEGVPVSVWCLASSLPDRSAQDNAIFVEEKTGRIALIQVSEYQDIPVHPNTAFIFAGYVAGTAFTTSIPVLAS